MVHTSWVLRAAGLIGALVIVMGTGCATNFTGSPHVNDGRKGCEAKCSAQGMEVGGMVYMGEYTSGCVCVVPGTSAKSRETLMASAVGAGAGAAGVVMQQRKQDSDSDSSSVFKLVR